MGAMSARPSRTARVGAGGRALPRLDRLALPPAQPLLLAVPERRHELCVCGQLLLPLSEALIHDLLHAVDARVRIPRREPLRKNLLEHRRDLPLPLSLFPALADSELIEVDKAGLRISGRGVRGGLQQPDRLHHIRLRDLLPQLHLRERLGDADQRLQDPRRRGDGPLRRALVAEVQVALDQRLRRRVADLREDPTPREGDVAPEELRVDRRLPVFLHAGDRVHRDQVRRESAVHVLIALVQHQPDKVEPRHEVLRKVNVLDDGLLHVV
mmetsp:Transcript_74405/g.215630  ORF Transcript_74405/g.215630 Transcript_74405/m.215630 type:complete len:269 (+) Transcript_74405:117-923(+)